MKSFIAAINWWDILNTSLSGVIIAAIVSVVLFFLNAASQRCLARLQLQNNVFVRFGELGQEMWFFSGRAQALHGNPQHASELTAVRLQMLSQQGALRALRLPILLHFGGDESLAEQLKRMGNLFDSIRDLLGEAALNRKAYETQQDSFHECYAKLYANLALRIEKRKRAKPSEIDHVAKVVMTK